MTDIPLDKAQALGWGSEKSVRRLRRRYAADRLLRFAGAAAIWLAVVLLGVLVISLALAGYKAFYQTKVELEVFLDPKVLKAEDLPNANYRKLVNDASERYFPGVTSVKDKRDLQAILSADAKYTLRNYVLADPKQIGQTVTLKIALSDPFDQLYKNVIPRQIDILSPQEQRNFVILKNRGFVSVTDGGMAVKLDLYIDPAKVNPQDLAAGQYKDILMAGLNAVFGGGVAASHSAIFSEDAPDVLKAYVAARPEAVGATLKDFPVPVSPHYATLNKGQTPQAVNPRFAGGKQLEWFDELEKRGLIRTPFSWELFLNADSRFPEQAGLLGAVTGTFLMLLVCFSLCFPVGIAAAIYLEEFAPKNKLTALIEVNINNLAAVPSVVFGLLGLALFINIFGLPRSSPLVGGLVLSLLTLPTIIIATRASLKAVPPSIRQAAFAIGASKHQVVLHHVLPFAMPGILTGTIIGMAHALGETAPLLLIGMNAFITSPPTGILEPATTLPTQIYSWADSPERGFISRTAAAILVLLAFLVLMNALAVIMRQRFERRW